MSIQRSFTLNWRFSGQVFGYGIGDMERLTGGKAAIRGLLTMSSAYGSYCLWGIHDGLAGDDGVWDS